MRSYEQVSFWIDGVGFADNFTTFISDDIGWMKDSPGNYKILKAENYFASVEKECLNRGLGYMVKDKMIIHPVFTIIKNEQAEFKILYNYIKNGTKGI